MSGDVVNLRLARKRRDRLGREAAAATNRAVHGETKAEREKTRAIAGKAARHLDGHRREGADDADGA